MKGKWTAVAIMFLALSGLLVSMPAGAEDTSYWTRVKSIFVDWDDDAKPGQAKTEVAGVRGLEVEKELGTKEYDWGAVKAMEDYNLSIDKMKAFLQEGKLGPYQGN